LITPKIYVLRGFISFAFDLQFKRWTRLPDLLRDRGYFQAVSHQGEIYAIGTYSVIAAGTIERYNSLSNQWAAATNMPLKLRSVGAAIYNNSLCITGGVDILNDATITTSSLFSFSTSKWEQNMTDILTPRFRHSAIQFKDELWIAGGSVSSTSGTNQQFMTTNSVEIYSHDTKQWTQGPPMQRPRDFFNLLSVLGRLYAGNHL
jgi:hypothetical protein